MSTLDAREAIVLDVTVEPPVGETERTGRATRVRRRIASILRTPSLLVAYAWLALVLAAAIAPALFTSGNPLTQDGDAMLLAPSGHHLFGTDDLGRDQFTRTVYGTQLSIKAAVVAVLIGLAGGSFIGLVAGAIRGWLDNVLMRAIDIMLAVPSLIVSLAIISALGHGTMNIAIAIGINSTASFARLMRSEVLKIGSAKYVEASVFAGHGYAYRLLRHVIPNASRSVLAYATMEIGSAILTVASLSFLGLGAPPPTPEWGLLVAQGRTFIATEWWISLLPGLVIVMSVLAIYRVGRSLNRGRTSVVA
ncbi:ABC transporter permease [Xylanimonas ulmi]|uniref:Peptide/nickel transport system permease protein n=1 Tax=Xylanimonas ulmi TaxID=228973 RepID=A0A4Q7M5S2_9MICO|nr:ABC transporter permease [Xylanibacterium ulmi]RZS61938.1 peptide/nickel transport system permease protein [Xylanibacterium ulmi]